MAVIGTILGLLALGVFLWAVVGLIRPELARLPNRASAVKLWAVSVAILVLGAVIMPEPPPPTEAELAERRAAAEAREDARVERAAAEAAREAEAAAAAERERAEAAEHERAAERAAAEATREAEEAEDRLVGVSNRVYPGVESVRRIATDLIADMGLQPGPLDAIPAAATFENFHWAGFPSAGGLRAVLNGANPSLAHLEWHEADGVMWFRTAEKVAKLPAPLPPEPTTEQKLAALDRLNAATDRVGAVMSEIDRKCAPPPAGSSYAPRAAYAKCLARFLVKVCPDLGEGDLNDMSNAARDMDAPVAASLLEHAALDCWTAVYYADTPTGAQLVGEAVIEMGEKMGEASARLH